ncbi:NifU family protein [Mycobacterium shigaense]|uniref:NifU family protein n=1 Tax=Mycobacterium shigaense TaxID=722731 RepID=UPI000E58F09F|nr:NifU family protein [Mycobacterium shigaense]MEA1124012.1 NifU family protein [Mycobacterium shigaense]
MDRPETQNSDTQWRTAGDRIQTLLDSCAASGPAAHDRAQQLVREIVGLYGAGLQRILALSDSPGLAERLATDDLVASLLLVHGLHPHDTRRRVADVLNRVRPYLGSHGGDVELLDVVFQEGGATVRLAFQGSCKSCPSSAATLELAVEDAVRAAAPEISAIEAVAVQAAADVIPAESLLAHVRSDGHGRADGSAWHPMPEVAELEPGQVAGFLISGAALLVCRVGDLPLAYRDHCPVCDGSLAGAQLHETLLGCPRCGAQFDIVHAGAGPDGAHLDPLPLLPRDGVPSIALPEPMGANT